MILNKGTSNHERTPISVRAFGLKGRKTGPSPGQGEKPTHGAGGRVGCSGR
jgi:hypothetical protein